MANTGPLSVLFLTSFLAYCLQYGHCDVYMHNPRGSNNRLNEASDNRRNANRLFDSQNNNRGGYNVGEFYRNRAFTEELQYNMKYFMSGSKHRTLPGDKGKSYLVIEWTNQHGCGNQDLNCDIILQYKCQNNRHGPMREQDKDTMRNGIDSRTQTYSKQTITTRGQKYFAKRRVHYRKGLHEPWEWYDKCVKRKRNGGLFTADQQLKGTTSIYTRQNPQGTRRGYECPEERDYYPYWHPTDWKDMAVLANSEKRCEYYKKNSFNTMKKGECLEYYSDNSGFKHYSEHNNPEACKNKGLWVEFTNFLEKRPDYTTKESCEQASTVEVPLVWGVPYVSEDIDALEMDLKTKKPKESCLVKLPEVDCRKANYSRVNHLGNAGNAQPMNYTWVIPYFPSGIEQRCVVRIRYNISTMDYDPYSTNSDQNGRDKSPVKNDPEIKVTKFNIPLQLAVNTAQFGRTFQDRSHVFILKHRGKSNVPDEPAIYNLNVRGKRGNIVQVYPAVEYDFVPNDLKMASNDLVHLQWTGSNTNPRNNAGEGRKGTDRNNIVLMEKPSENIKVRENEDFSQNARLVWSPYRETKTQDDLSVLLTSSGFYKRVRRGEPYYTKLNRRDRTKFQSQLDNSPPSLSVLVQMKKGHYNLMCTRNNNFSNRNQKGTLTVR